MYERERAENEDFDGERPVRRRRLTNDATIEKLGSLLKENPNGMLVFRDELYGFLMSMEKRGHESDRQFYLESYNGNGPFVVDRIERGTIDVPALCLSILGGIQPDRISSYFSQAVKNGSGDDGFMSRFQVMVYPPRSTSWELVDQHPDSEARDRAYSIFERLDEFNFHRFGFEQGKFDDLAARKGAHDVYKQV